MIIPPVQSLWIFGYGSLIWKPGFEYEKKVTGHIRGYSRKFWQSNTTHRGTPSNPGRVATLVPTPKNVVWGIAYRVTGQNRITEALHHLNGREIVKGGYTMFKSDFYQRESNESITVIVYTATSENHLFTGPENEEDIAERIVTAHGPSGHNVEYVTKIINFMRDSLPSAFEQDEHLNKLEIHIRLKLARKRISNVEDLWHLGTSKFDSVDTAKSRKTNTKSAKTVSPARLFINDSVLLKHQTLNRHDKCGIGKTII